MMVNHSNGRIPIVCLVIRILDVSKHLKTKGFDCMTWMDGWRSKYNINILLISWMMFEWDVDRWRVHTVSG